MVFKNTFTQYIITLLNSYNINKYNIYFYRIIQILNNIEQVTVLTN